jgi:transcriptional regulator with XRE-family HTH domain
VAKKTAPLLPSSDALLSRFGERLRMARLRRRLAAKQVAERAGMSPMTLRSLERGGSGVTMGAYLAVMQVLGIEGDLDRLGQLDPLGRELQDARLTARPVATRPSPLPQPAVGPLQAVAKKPLKPAPVARDWIESSRFASAESLAGLIDPPPSSTQKQRR